jgi:molybdopterin/thiamine biosynthesis adenylyltransferase
MDSGQLAEIVRSFGRKRHRPDQSSYTGLLLADARKIADRTGMSLREVEDAALAEGILPERYSRNQKYMSCPDQLRLLRAHVAIIGLGGLGGTVTEILARLGVGTLTLVDGDVFDESNLNRQLLSSPGRLGQKKAAAGGERVVEINPAVTVRVIDQFLTADNALAILAGVQLAVDCLDTVTARFVLEEGCRLASIPLVSAAIAGTSGQATTIFPGDPGLKLIYGGAANAPAKGVEASLGTLPFAAVYMAAAQCAEITTILLGRPPELRHRLLLAEICDHTAELVDLAPRAIPAKQ